MSSISNNTAVPSATTIHMLTANNQGSLPISAELYQVLQGLGVSFHALIYILKEYNTPSMREQQQDQINLCLMQYCQYAGPDQDQLNQILEKAGLVKIGQSPYLSPKTFNQKDIHSVEKLVKAVDSVLELAHVKI